MDALRFAFEALATLILFLAVVWGVTIGFLLFVKWTSSLVS